MNATRETDVNLEDFCYRGKQQQSSAETASTFYRWYKYFGTTNLFALCLSCELIGDLLSNFAMLINVEYLAYVRVVLNNFELTVGRFSWPLILSGQVRPSVISNF